jgi:hypothetical protein
LGWPAKMCRLWRVHSRYANMNGLIFQVYTKILVDDGPTIRQTTFGL